MTGMSQKERNKTLLADFIHAKYKEIKQRMTQIACEKSSLKYGIKTVNSYLGLWERPEIEIEKFGHPGGGISVTLHNNIKDIFHILYNNFKTNSY